MLIAVKNKFSLSLIIIFGTLSFPVPMRQFTLEFTKCSSRTRASAVYTLPLEGEYSELDFSSVHVLSIVGGVAQW